MQPLPMTRRVLRGGERVGIRNLLYTVERSQGPRSRFLTRPTLADEPDDFRP
jgi:hypothetical protein